MVKFKRSRTPSKHIYYTLHLLIVAQQFHWELIKKYGKNPVSTDGGDGGSGTWYPQACRFLKLRHHHTHLLTHSYYYEKSIIIERTIQYTKKIDRTEMFMIIFHVKKIIVH